MNSKENFTVFLALGLSVAVASLRADAPAVMWASYPVGAGDHVLVHGGAWGKDVRVVTDGGKTCPATVLSDTGLVFPFPADSERIVEGRVVSDAGKSAPFALNAPTPWWLQGDAGDSSTPGGTLRIFGRSLAPYGKAATGTPRVLLGDRELALEKTDVWSLDARVPSDMPPGRYAVKIRNGLAGGRGWYDAGTWEVAAPRAVWKDDRFDVEDFGAESNDDASDSDAFDAAMAAAAANGGGTVFVPAGRFVLTRTLVIPPHVLLKGEDRALAQICWPDTMDPPPNLIEGTHSFGIHDLFISSGQYRNGIVANTEIGRSGQMDSRRGTTTHDVSLRRLRVKLVSDQWRDSKPGDFLPRYTMRGDGIIVRNCLRAEIVDCDIYCDKDAQRTLFFNFTGDCIRMADCRINGTGWAIFGGDRCIFENNTANNCTYSISSVCRRMFWSRNRQTDLYTNNREAVTHDGAKTAFRARRYGEQGCASGVVDGTRVRLVYPPDIAWKSGTNYAEWVGSELQVVDGRGAGQTRTVTAMKGYEELEIDRPFDVAPDASSLFVIVAERKHLIYVDNDTEDAATAIQLYGGATDCVLARNRCRRAGGFQGSGRDYHGIITCWFVQFFGNVVEEGNGHRGAIGTGWRGAGGSVIGAFPPNVKWPLSQSYVCRDNEIRSNGSIFVSVKNALVERNTVRRSDVGIASRRYQDTMFVANNVFDRVDVPYHHLDGARITPPYVDRTRETMLAALRGGTFKAKSRTQMRRAFAMSVKPHPWHREMRAAVAGQRRAPFDLPVTVTFDGALAKDVRSVSLAVPASGGWDFGGAVALEKGADGFAGKLRVTPPKEGAVGLFAWPVAVTLAGEGWKLATQAWVDPVSQYRFLSWETALAEPGKQPTAWRTLKYLEGMDGHESVFPEKLYGAAHEGRDFHARTRINVIKPTRFSFTRGNAACRLILDGKELIRAGASPSDAAVVTLEPGEHRFEIVRPASAAVLPAGTYEGIFLHCTFPEGCVAGDWVQVNEE